MEKTNQYLTRKEIRAFFRTLANSQGFYGRLLRDIDSLDAEQADDFWSHLALEMDLAQSIDYTEEVIHYDE